MLDCLYMLLIAAAAADDDVRDPDIIDINFCNQLPVNHMQKS